ncbi:4Fe-4S dicluster domain-containing protein [Geobacter hydrogenophilus]|uniref:4Fe-4S ferredoxin n=1 Tax=Geobacter hydrogenophilus TaxID=40983 RepID=A0A9W6G0Q8_9BACT|nr:4Fe-4S dicluster domain-containing protein [Geobacter hydrogenophilus]MBT0894347.1 4Fe-4S dicluster domain-containing protein [Geobacter hydrogenophilus]GLI38366.1 4Fe-4S ferredoxin [Geobacter hydrogenophilus]
MNRRDFLKNSITVIAGLAVPLSALELISPRKLLATKGDESPVRWAFLVDTQACVGCGFCVKACKTENEIPHETNITRTWVERYVVTRKGKTYVDSPRGARDGFTTDRIDQGEEGFREVKAEEIEKAFFVPKLCNQCDNPACVQVCPVGATYQTPDGVVLVDRKHCIGCAYCIMACPYGVRSFNPAYKTAEKCTFCYHRISQGMKTACVDACPFGARKIGNLRDPDDPVTKTIMSGRVGVLKEQYGTKPQVYYLALSREVK